MADIFFSYSSKDRDRVQPVRDALAKRGFEIVWDHENLIPGTANWGNWIKQNVANARCVVVFWSANSVASEHVEEEANLAKKQNKLIPVLLEPISEDQLPYGFSRAQSARLMGWSGARDDPEWKKLLVGIERVATPGWVREKLEDLQTQARAHEDAHARAEEAQERLNYATLKQEELRRDRDRAQKEAAAVRTELREVTEALRGERDRAEAEAAAARAEAEKIKKTRAQNGAARALFVGLLALMTGAAGAFGLQAVGWIDLQKTAHSRKVQELQAELAKTKSVEAARQEEIRQMQEVIARREAELANMTKTQRTSSLEEFSRARQTASNGSLLEPQELEAERTRLAKVGQDGRGPPGDPRQNLRVLQDVAFVGDYTRHWVPQTTIQCRGACLETVECKAYEFAPGVCLLYQRVTAQHSQNGRFSGRWE